MRFRVAKSRWGRGMLGAFALVCIAGVAFLLVQWKRATDHGGQQYAEPFRIAGNLYYVGANDVASFLLTGPEGHVLIDGGYPGTAPMIQASVEELGFDIRDVRRLLVTHFHFDHAGGLAALQEASGAALWVSEGDADAVAAGGDHPDMGLLRPLVWSGLARYPRPRIDHRIGDKDTVRLGPIELTAHVTAGHTPGCTTWTFPVAHGGSTLLAGLVCGIGMSPRLPLAASSPDAIRAAFERSLQRWRSLPVDIFLAPHARAFGRWRKFQAQAEAADPANPFVDPEGYRAFIESTEVAFRSAYPEEGERP